MSLFEVIINFIQVSIHKLYELIGVSEKMWALQWIKGYFRERGTMTKYASIATCK